MRRINPAIRTIWGISDVGFSTMSMMENAFLVFFLTDVARLPLSITAVITGFSAIADAVSAVIAGIVIDKTNMKGGKYRPWLLYCPPIVTICFVFCFTKIGGDTTAGVIIGAGYILSHFIWNIAWTANKNLAAVLTDDPTERAFLSGRFAMGTNLGKIVATWLVPFIVAQLTASLSGVTAYTVAALIAALLFTAAYFIHYGITSGYDTEPMGSRKSVTFADMGRGVATNPHLLTLLVHDAVRLIPFYGVAGAATYYTKMVVGDPGSISWVLFLYNLGCVFGASMSSRFAKMLGVKKASILACLAAAVCLASISVIPPSAAAISAVLFVCQVCFGVAYGLTTTLYGMCGTYSMWKTGDDTRGVVMAICSLAIKLAIALRGILIAAFLGWIAYDPAAAPTPEAAAGIKLLFYGVFAGIIAVSVVPMLFFGLSEDKVSEMEREIAAKA